MRLLQNIAWNFNKNSYNSIADFNQRVIEYQLAIMKERACWKSDEIVIDSPIIDVAFTAWIKEGDLAKNENLLEEGDFFDDAEDSENGYFQAEIKARLEADNGRNFTALELLYKLDEQMKSKELGDHIFFEGLSEEGETDGAVPLFYMACGS